MRYFPGVLAGVVAATAILAAASASAPLFFSSAANHAVEQRIAEVTPWQAGLMLRMTDDLAGASAEAGERATAVRDAVAGIDHLGRPVATVFTLSSLWPADRPEDSADVHPVTRSGAVSHVQVLARLEQGRVRVAPQPVADPLRRCGGRSPTAVEGVGLLLTDTLASELDLCPGDAVRVGAEQGAGYVSAIYRDLRDTRADRFWELLAPQYEPEIAPSLLIVDRKDFFELAPSMGGDALLRWEVPVVPSGLTLGEAEATARRLGDLVRGANAGGSLFPPAHFPDLHADSLLLNIREESEAMVSRSRAPVNFLALGGTLLALGVTAAAGVYAVQRRRVEFNLLSTRGVSPAALGARASLEAGLPAAVGTFVGWGAAFLMVHQLGPGGALGADALRPSLTRVAYAAVAGVALLGVVTAAGVRGRMRAPVARMRGVLRTVPWDVGLLVLSYVTWRDLTQTAERASSDTSRTLEVDVLVFLFPVLFLAGATGLVTRLLRWILPKLRTAGGSLSPPLFLAVRRLAAASAIALTLVVIAAVSIGAFLYADTLSASGRATVDAKALTFVGSDVSVPLPQSPVMPEAVDYPVTIVRELNLVRLVPGEFLVDVLGIDPTTFREAAFWDDSFADVDLESLLARLRWREGTRSAPAFVTGMALEEREMVLEGKEGSIPLRLLGTTRSFPGIFSTRPMVVVNRRALEPGMVGTEGSLTGAAGSHYEAWIKGSPERVIADLEGAGVSLSGAVTAPEARESPSLLPLEWSFGFLEGLGAASGAMAVIGMLLYLQARQASRVVAGALAARMGLSSAAHRLSIALELGLMLTIAFGLGSSLSAVAATLVYDRIDPLPIVPPPPLLRMPIEGVVMVGILSLLAVAVGAWAVQRTADRADVAEVLRVAG